MAINRLHAVSPFLVVFLQLSLSAFNNNSHESSIIKIE